MDLEQSCMIPCTSFTSDLFIVYLSRLCQISCASKNLEYSTHDLETYLFCEFVRLCKDPLCIIPRKILNFQLMILKLFCCVILDFQLTYLSCGFARLWKIPSASSKKNLECSIQDLEAFLLCGSQDYAILYYCAMACLGGKTFQCIINVGGGWENLQCVPAR